MEAFSMIKIISWLAALAALLSVGAIAAPFLKPDRSSARVKELSKRRDELAREQMDELTQRNSMRNRPKNQAQQELMKTILEKLKMEDKLSSKVLKEQLSQAGFRGQSVLITYLFARIAGSIAGAIAVLVVVTLWQDFPYPAPVKMLMPVAGAAIGFYLPRIMVSNYAQKRQQDMTRGFPDAMDLLVICVEAGLSTENAFDRVTEEIADSSPTLSQELGLTTAELAYLGDRRKAFENFSTRTGLPAAKSLATTLIQSEKYGTPVALALKVLAQERREERMSNAEKKAASLPAKLTVPMIVFFLPVLFMVVIGPAIIQIVRME